MEKRILKSYSRFIILFSLSLLVSINSLAQQEQKAESKKKSPTEYDYKEIPFIKSISVGYDLMGPIYKGISGDYMSNEVYVDISIKNRFIPVIELGYGNSNKLGDKGIHYKAKAPYMRVGMDYNFFYKKKHHNLLSLGVRYGFTSFDYEVASMPLIDNTWGDEIDNPGIHDDVWGESVRFDQNKFSGNMHWLEFVATVRTKVFRNFHMGWSLRMRTKMSAKKGEEANPWYVPGYGIYKNMRFGVHYSIIYTIPFGKKKK